jgi:hypothetical protein
MRGDIVKKRLNLVAGVLERMLGNKNVPFA